MENMFLAMFEMMREMELGELEITELSILHTLGATDGSIETRGQNRFWHEN